LSILARYLAREILGAILVATAALLMLFAFLDFINEVTALGPGYTLSLALLYILLMLPTHVLEVLPAATIVGALFAFARLSGSSEFTVMRASGLSVYRLAGYMTALGLVIAALSHVLGEYVVPHTERTAHQLKTRATTGVVAQQFRTGLWAKDGTSFINIREMLPDASLRDMRVYVFDAHFRLTTIRHAERAEWDADGSWRLTNVVQTRIGPQGTRTERLPTMKWQSDLNPDLLAVLMIPPERMSIHALRTYVEHLRENRQKTTRYEIALWSKLSFTLASPVMLLLALPFAYAPARSSHVGGRVLIGLLIGLAFHLFNRLSGHLGLLYDWPPAASALSALVVFGLGAAIALWRVERR
jgi:lipopolysaccharide export system permease protein